MGVSFCPCDFDGCFDMDNLDLNIFHIFSFIPVANVMSI
jgi:hypothetical protein